MSHFSDLIGQLSERRNHVLVADNFFSSFSLISQLSSETFRYLGVTCGNRANTCRLKSDCDLKVRGEYEYLSNGTCLFLKWKDNNKVILGSYVAS